MEDKPEAKLPTNTLEAISRLKNNSEFITQLLKILKVIAKKQIASKGGISCCDAGDIATDAIIAVFEGRWAWDPQDGRSTSLGLPSWTSEMESLCYRCCNVIRSKVDGEYQKSKRQESGKDDAWLGTVNTESAESTTAVDSEWTGTPLEVLICQENWEEVEAMLPKELSSDNQLLLKMIDQIAHSSPLRNASPAFTIQDIRKPRALAFELLAGHSNLSAFIRTQFADETRKLSLPEVEESALAQALATELNKIIHANSIAGPDLLSGVELSETAESLRVINPDTDERYCLQRLLLECAFPEEISQRLHYTYQEGLARRKSSWANRELAAALGVSEAAIVNAKRQLENTLAPWLWSRFKELLPNDGRPWLALVDDAEQAKLPEDWESTFAKKHSMTVGEVVEMGVEVLAKFQEWIRRLHRTVETKKKKSCPQLPTDGIEAEPQEGNKSIPIPRALQRKLNRFTKNIQESEQV